FLAVGGIEVGDGADDLCLWRESVVFALHVHSLEHCRGKREVLDEDRCRYFDTSTGSAFECASGLDVLVAKGKLTPELAEEGKEHLAPIVKMLVNLIKSISDRDYPKLS